MTALSTLRALLAAATPLPWEAVKFCADHYVAEVGTAHVVPLPDVAPSQDHMHDAALIAAAVNALPALIAVAEAAGEAEQALTPCRDGCECRYANLRDALAALAKVTP